MNGAIIEVHVDGPQPPPGLDVYTDFPVVVHLAGEWQRCGLKAANQSRPLPSNGRLEVHEK